MPGLCFVTVAMALFLSVQNTLGAIDQHWLSDIVHTIRNKYGLDDTYIWAVNIPENQDPSRLKEVLKDDPPETVIKAVSKGDVYQGKRLTASTQALSLSHFLEKIQVSTASNHGNALIIFSQKYPNENGIAANIKKVIQNWKCYAYIFSKVVNVADAGIAERTELFKEQELSKIGLKNIFRCYELGVSFRCRSCSSVENIAPSCVADPLSSNYVTGLEKRTIKQGRNAGRSSRDGRRAKGGRVRGRGRRAKGGRVRGGGRRAKGGKVRVGGRHSKAGRVKGGGRRAKGGRVKGGGRRAKGGKVKGGGRRAKGGRVKGSGRRVKGGEVRGGGRLAKGGKVRGGGRSSKDGRVKGGRRRAKGGRVKGSGRRVKGGEVRGGGRLAKGGKVRGGGRRAKGGRVRGGGRRAKGGRVKGGGRRAKGGKLRGGGRRAKGGRVKGGGRHAKGGRVKGGGRHAKGGNIGKGGICKLHTMVRAEGKSTKS